jgi:ketosteroid isomerase-like protein
MQRIHTYLLCLIALACSTAYGTLEHDKEALRALKTTYETAIAQGDIESLEPFLAEDFTGVMVTGESITGMQGLLDYWATLQDYLGDNGIYTVELLPNDTLFVDSIAITSGSTRDSVTISSGEVFEFTSEWTAIARKEGESWKLVRIQATMDPINNPFIEKIGSLKLIATAGIAALAAAVLVALVMRRRK